MSKKECYKKLREIRWPDGQVQCPRCSSNDCEQVGKAAGENLNQKYLCGSFGRYFNDLTGTMFKNSNLPLKSWMCSLYLMGLNTSNLQIAKELGVSGKTAQNKTRKLRTEVQENAPTPLLSGEVELDEVYVVAGHKGHPESVKKKGRKARRRRLKGAGGRGTLEKEKPSILAMIQRGGEVVIRMLENVKQATIKPLIEQFIASDTITHTDEYRYSDIYSRL